MQLEEIIKNESVSQLDNYLSNNKFNTSQLRKIMRTISKSKWDIDNFKGYSQTLNWFWFNISLLRMKDFDESMVFINNNLDYFTSWYLVDGTLNFLKRKNLTFEKVYFYAERYTNDRREFVVRFGYLLFFTLKMESEEIKGISKLLKDDSRYYVQMMEAWLISEMIAKNPSDGYILLKDSVLKYNILGKAIQKCLDSFRISDELKQQIKALRESKKNN